MAYHHTHCQLGAALTWPSYLVNGSVVVKWSVLKGEKEKEWNEKGKKAWQIDLYYPSRVLRTVQSSPPRQFHFIIISSHIISSDHRDHHMWGVKIKIMYVCMCCSTSSKGMKGWNEKVGKGKACKNVDRIFERKLLVSVSEGIDWCLPKQEAYVNNKWEIKGKERK